MSYESDLPTIKQILAKADSLQDKPMSSEEAMHWFNETFESNRAARRSAETKGNSKQ